MKKPENVNLSRRGFLRGRVHREPPVQRPPGALAEAFFPRTCTRCGECIRVCPTSILVAKDGLPSVDFSRGQCTFCGECVKACRPGALQAWEEGDPPWLLRASVGESCLARRGVECRACGDACDVAAIRFSPRLGGPPEPRIDQLLCTGCGACVRPCPVGAISLG